MYGLSLQILHLIGYAVQEQESGHYLYFTFYERASLWGILNLMEELVTSPRVSEFIKVIIQQSNLILATNLNRWKPIAS